jgi:hypothetical protein
MKTKSANSKMTSAASQNGLSLPFFLNFMGANITLTVRSLQLLSVPCPTCGVAIKESCELNTGYPRNEPHRNRKFAAADALHGVESYPG